MKLVTYNIRFGLGADCRLDLARIVGSVQDADIIALQEVERFWKRTDMTDQPAIIGEHLKEFYWVYCAAFDVDASQRKRDATVLNRRRQFGPMLLSRWPILSSRCIVLPKLGTTDCFNMDTGAVECVIATPTAPLRVYSLHLSAISPRERLMQIDHLLALHRNAQASGSAWDGAASIHPNVPREALDLDWSNGETAPPMPKETVLMGDFNSTAQSDEYEKIVGKLDICYGRVSHLDGLVDSWEVAKQRSGECITWYPHPPELPPGHALRLDYCYVTSGLAKNVARAWVDHTAQGSDHLPYWIELDL